MPMIWVRTKAAYFLIPGLTLFRKIRSDLPIGLSCRSCASRLRLHAKQISSQKIVGWAKRQRAHHSGGALADRWCHLPARTRWSSSTSVRVAHGCAVHKVAKVWCRIEWSATFVGSDRQKALRSLKREPDLCVDP